MAKIDKVSKIINILEDLNIDELCALNRIVVETIKSRRDAELSVASFDFDKGDCVSFIDEKEIKRYGVVLKRNKKTVTVVTKELYSFNVPGTYLTHEKKPSKALLKLKDRMFLTKERFAEMFNLENGKLSIQIND
jgi:hypothetical protein